MSLISQTSLPLSTPDLLIRQVPCDSSVIVGDWVYLDSSGVAFKAIATGAVQSNVFGIIESKDSAVLCNVRTMGQSSELFSSLDPSKDYFLSSVTAGAMTQMPPAGSAEYVVSLGRPVTDKRFLVLRPVRMQRA